MQPPITPGGTPQQPAQPGPDPRYYYAPPQPPKKRHTVRNVLLGILAFFGLLCGIGAIVAAVSPSHSGTPASLSTQVPATAASGHVLPGQRDPNITSPKVEVITPASPAAPPMTAGQRQALGKAKDYLEFEHFSRAGLIHQLVVAEGFTTADATYGVDHSGADWMVQAEGKAKDYLEFEHFSRAGLIHQLVVAEGFTQAEAEHGATAAGL